MDADAVFHFTLAEIVQVRLPLPILLQIFRDMPGEKNVARIAAIHDPLCDVDAGARDVRLFVQIRDFVDRTAVNSHADPKFGMLLELLTDFHSAQRTGASGLVRNTRAPPSPVGKRSSLPSASAVRNCSVPRTISLNVCICSLCWFMSNFE